MTGHNIFVPVTAMLELGLEWVLRSRFAFAPKVIARALEGIGALGNVVLGERTDVLAAAARMAQGWDFADALHHALSEGCDDFATLEADLARRASRDAKTLPIIIRL